MRVPFTKVDATGNDFVVVDLSDVEGPAAWERVWGRAAVEMCDRRRGVGADGLVTVSRQGGVADVATTNPDGSVATVCGNALRGVALFLSDRYGETRGELRMSGRPHRFSVAGGTACVSLPGLSGVTGPSVHEGQELYVVHTGTEHVVAFTDDVESVDVAGLGRRIRHAPGFAPLGTNVNFVQVVTEAALRVRTYERGVEAETLSCGSGAVASALVARWTGRAGAEALLLHTRAGSPLRVRFAGDSRSPSQACLCGEASIVFSGTHRLRHGAGTDPVAAR